MSLICLGITCPNTPDEFEKLKQQLSLVAVKYRRGITFKIDWHEPLVDALVDYGMIFSLSDSPESDNCEMLLLPDGCYFNEQTDNISLQKRMLFLQELSKVIIATGHSVEYYIGLSGTLTAEYDTFMVQNRDLPLFLEKVISSFSPIYAIHLVVY